MALYTDLNSVPSDNNVWARCMISGGIEILQKRLNRNSTFIWNTCMKKHNNLPRRRLLSNHDLIINVNAGRKHNENVRIHSKLFLQSDDGNVKMLESEYIILIVKYS